MTDWVVNNHIMQHFTLDEFRCPCCYRKDMQPKALVAFDKIRDRAKVPMIVTSGYRCLAHNTKINASTNSSHLRGHGGDFAVSDARTRYRLLYAALEVGVSRVGIGKNHIHFDVDPSLDQCVVWDYYPDDS